MKRICEIYDISKDYEMPIGTVLIIVSDIEKEKMPGYRHKKQYSGIKKPRNTNVPRYWQIISTCQVTVVFALQISTLKT